MMSVSRPGHLVFVSRQGYRQQSLSLDKGDIWCSSFDKDTDNKAYLSIEANDVRLSTKTSDVRLSTRTPTTMQRLPSRKFKIPFSTKKESDTHTISKNKRQRQYSARTSVRANDNSNTMLVPSVGANDNNEAMLVPSVGANDNNNVML